MSFWSSFVARASNRPLKKVCDRLGIALQHSLQIWWHTETNSDLLHFGSAPMQVSSGASLGQWLELLCPQGTVLPSGKPAGDARSPASRAWAGLHSWREPRELRHKQQLLLWTQKNKWAIVGFILFDAKLVYFIQNDLTEETEDNPFSITLKSTVDYQSTVTPHNTCWSALDSEKRTGKFRWVHKVLVVCTKTLPLW